MRKRVTIAAAVGGLALSAIVLPVAMAGDEQPLSAADALAFARDAEAGVSQSARAAGPDAEPEYGQLDATFSGVKINKGKPVVVGTRTVTVPVTFTLKHGAGLDVKAPDFSAGVELYRGSYDNPANVLLGTDSGSCKKVSATSATCTAGIEADPEYLENADATTWRAVAYAVDFNGRLDGVEEESDLEDVDWSKIEVAEQDRVATARLQRHSRLTANASPEPVVKGGTLTVTGALTRVDWNTGKYAGYTGQGVALQAKKAGGSAYSTVKPASSVKTGSKGVPRTTVTASVDSTWRWSFAGTATTAAVNSVGDYADVVKPAQAKPAAKPKPDAVYYENCTAARAAGGAPVYAGGPGYGRHLDRDGDGVGCE